MEHTNQKMMATQLTRDEKIIVLEQKYKHILDKMDFESRNIHLRKMIRRMKLNDWFVLLQEKASC
jgi:hypothetical protein